MDERKKYAYRYLLYWCIASEARRNAWFRLPWNPLRWSEAFKSVRRAGATANWMHNLALFSALDFRDFDEARFWREFESYVGNEHSGSDIGTYRGIFERGMTEYKTSIEDRTNGT